ncbi:pilus assembly protein PilQ [Pseudomonas protegens]|jgi:type II secretory ATPase GspE/PulE/Tfp pilus assembly ATPase PilB-like protein|uniref:Pilus assembly protein PilQ n=2 Tax=Pseudomonas protegens TaxID=380021 RepID=Q4K7M2_PSEF5|nr:ATPase, T2SS/T4P/T4SS family [Pseudomonas protegens]AAY93921.1 pilus assembly protein PilQ [Pseudomonas protegens Pf-5]ASE21921.1 pilus assembly protein PilQ [Pseudomonas protegens]QEZ54396.1 pilus assembly protein PilQ [Pseudomonas protegens]QEZ59402.1 pilus assembly protein PilQ [Pseudomonas protegens]QEZ65681.1 pilus assembly protein PilQ [Pseudomonas protegens]
MTILETPPLASSLSTTPQFAGAVLTAQGERFELKPDQRQICALTEDGTLHISAQHQADPHVMAFMDKLEHEQFEYVIKLCSMTDIRSIYQASSQIPGSDQIDTVRQAHALRILADAHKRGASDIHIVVGYEITKIFYRIHGLLWEAGQEKSGVGLELCSALYNSMCDVTKDHFQPTIPQDARVARSFVETLGLFGARLSTRPLVDGPLMVMRLLYDDESKASLEDLGFLPEQIAQYARLRSLPYGVNLITGPTGSGKSKSLQINLNLLFEETEGTRHILTIEDPPEYPLKANQSPLGPGESWQAGIKSSVRLDPDVLMYGEIRDLESAQAAYSGGMTGHLVWGTLHTNNAVASLQRLIDMGVPDYLVTDPALTTGLINQSLLPVLCQSCCVPLRDHLDSVSQGLRERLEQLQIIDQVNLVGPGCPHCKKLGVAGRTVVAEILMTDLLFMKVFSELGASAARRHWVKEMGGITKIEHAIRKIKAGTVDPRHAETLIGPLDFDRQLVELSHA